MKCRGHKININLYVWDVNLGCTICITIVRHYTVIISAVLYCRDLEYEYEYDYSIGYIHFNYLTYSITV